MNFISHALASTACTQTSGAQMAVPIRPRRPFVPSPKQSTPKWQRPFGGTHMSRSVFSTYCTNKETMITKPLTLTDGLFYIKSYIAVKREAEDGICGWEKVCHKPAIYQKMKKENNVICQQSLQQQPDSMQFNSTLLKTGSGPKQQNSRIKAKERQRDIQLDNFTFY